VLPLLVDSWPECGDLVFNDFQVKYRDNLPLVLKGLSFKVKDGEHIGICGRTGSGKSTLIMSILRVIEGFSGSILINGQDIS